MAAPSTTHRFKKAFAHMQANIDVDGKMKGVTSSNLTDEDVELLQLNGYGHLIEPLAAEGPEAEVDNIDRQIADLQAKRTALLTPAVVEPTSTEGDTGDKSQTTPDLHKLHKPELQAKYKEVLGREADEQLTKAELIKSIEAGPDNQ